MEAVCNINIINGNIRNQRVTVAVTFQVYVEEFFSFVFKFGNFCIYFQVVVCQV